MTHPSGFGQPTAKKKASPGAKQRAAAAQEFDRMKQRGMPEYEVYLRIQGKKQWFPVGAIAVHRSNQIHEAIYANEESLLQGAFRLFPVLKKNQNSLEYGYRLKEYKDEPIQLAVRPAQKGSNPVQGAINQVSTALGNLFGKKS